MNNFRQQWAEEKQQMESLTAPAELKHRLERALATAAPPRRKQRTWMWTAAVSAVCFMMIIGNSYHAFAYYGKKLLGYDEVINGTLRQLNDAGQGQPVDKKMTLADGTTLTIEGLMSDANQLIMYYRLSNPDGLERDSGEVFAPSGLTGFFTKSGFQSGTSIANEDHTELTGMLAFESVSPFAKKLTLHFWQRSENNLSKEESLSFPYYPDEAMRPQFKQSIHQTLEVDQGIITFRSITATPTMTLIKGEVKVDNFDRVGLALHGIELLADGTPVDLLGSGSRSSFGGRTFELRYDVLPEQTDSLTLAVRAFAGYQGLDRKLDLSSIGNEELDLGGRNLWVKQVSTTPQGVHITLATEEDVMLEGVSIGEGDRITELQTTVNTKYTKQEDGRMLKERTLIFDTETEPEFLLIEGIHYLKEYNKAIEIPLK